MNWCSANQAHCAEVASKRGWQRKYTRAGSTGDTAGGTFVPPLWVLSEYVELARAGRLAVRAVTQRADPVAPAAFAGPGGADREGQRRGETRHVAGRRQPGPPRRDEHHRDRDPAQRSRHRGAGDSQRDAATRGQAQAIQLQLKFSDAHPH